MSDNQENIKKKKTLSLKLGSKPLIAPKRNIEAGKTVIVEKKRYKRNPNSENQFQKLAKSDPPTTPIFTLVRKSFKNSFISDKTFCLGNVNVPSTSNKNKTSPFLPPIPAYLLQQLCKLKN